MEKWPFFRVATAGLGIYHKGGYGPIGVYRVNKTRKGFLAEMVSVICLLHSTVLSTISHTLFEGASSP